MRRKPFAHILLSMVVAFAQVAAADDCGDAAQQVEKQCSDAILKANGASSGANSGINSALNPGSQGVNQPSNALAAAASNSAANGTTAQTTCQTAQQNCSGDSSPIKCSGQPASEKQTVQNNCTSAVQAMQKGLASNISAANQAAGQSTSSGNAASGSSGSNGSGSGMSAAAMGALGALAGAMLAQQMADQNNTSTATAAALPVTTTLQPDGSLNCSMYDSYQYPGCDTYNKSACALQAVSTTVTPYSTPTAVATTTVDCSDFTARYCSTTASAAQTYNYVTASSSVVQETIGGSGEGSGSTYCKQSIAASYCSSSGTSSCPSCQWLQSSMSANCQANPAVCMATNSSAVLGQASATCSGDPVFTNPANSYVGSSMIASASTTSAASTAVLATNSTSTTGGLPTVVLPQSVSPSTISGTSRPTTVSTASTRTNIAQRASASVASGLSAAAAGAGLREGSPTGTANGNAFAAQSVSGSSASREIASAGDSSSLNSIAGIRTASAGPASDVIGQYGPSLFSASTNVIRMRCQAGKLNNCP